MPEKTEFEDRIPTGAAFLRKERVILAPDPGLDDQIGRRTAVVGGSRPYEDVDGRPSERAPRDETQLRFRRRLRSRVVIWLLEVGVLVGLELAWRFRKLRAWIS